MDEIEISDIALAVALHVHLHLSTLALALSDSDQTQATLGLSFVYITHILYGAWSFSIGIFNCLVVLEDETAGHACAAPTEVLVQACNELVVDFNVVILDFGLCPQLLNFDDSFIDFLFQF